MGFPVTVVLGASGRIGTVLRQCWPQQLPTAAPLRWQARRRPAQLPEPEASAAAENWAILDPLEQPQALTRLLRGADVVLCLAGVVPGRPTSGADSDLADNWRLSEAVVRAAAVAAAEEARPPARVLLASSAAVYGAQPGLLREDAPLQPTNAYGRAKVDMEQRSLALARALGVPVTVLRIGNIAGLDAILGGWRNGFTLDQFSDGRSPRRSYIGVRTLADILAALVAQPDLPTVLNLAQPRPVEMAALLRAAGRDFAWRVAPASAIAEVGLDLTELRRCLLENLSGGAADLLAPADPAQMLAEWGQLESAITSPNTKERPQS